MTFCTPSLPGSSQQDSPSLTGWGIAGLSGNQEIDVSDSPNDLLRENWDFLSSDLLLPRGGEKITSPIEFAFFRCFHYISIGLDEADRLTIEPQVKIGRYTADFTINSKGGEVLLVVECDGHDFHDGNKIAAARDKERDRWFTANGYAVFRFTGSQIYQRPFLCVCDSISCAMKRLEG